MKQNHNRRQHRVALGLFCVFSLFETESYAAPGEIASHTANVGGVQLHYLTAGKGPAILLFDGYTQTSRTWRPWQNQPPPIIVLPSHAVTLRFNGIYLTQILFLWQLRAARG